MERNRLALAALAAPVAPVARVEGPVALLAAHSARLAHSDDAADAAHAANAAPGRLPVPALPAAQAGDDKVRARHVIAGARPVRGRSASASARSNLSELVLDALGRRIEVALRVPTGPCQIDGHGKRPAHERALTPARPQALRRLLVDRGIDPKHIFVASRIDAQVKEPRLDVPLRGQPVTD